MENKQEGSNTPSEKPQQRPRFNTSTVWLLLVLLLVAVVRGKQRDHPGNGLAGPHEAGLGQIYSSFMGLQ